MGNVRTVYPDWVRQFKTKGYSIKRKGDRYYLYKHSSTRVPGKKYPQAKDTYVGIITPDGVVYAKNALLPVGDEIHVREFGFSKTLLLICPDEWKQCVPLHWEDVLKRTIIRNSVNSFLLDDDKLKQDVASVNYPVQFTNLGRRIHTKYGLRMKDLEPLKTIYLVRSGNKRPAVSYINPEQQEILDKLGVTLEVD